MAAEPTPFQRALPNALTVLRIALALPVALLIVSDTLWAAPVALVLFAFAASLDWFDGYLARKWNVITDFGRALDPVADKVLVAAALLGLAADGLLGFWLLVPATIILGRDFVICGMREFAAGERRTLHVSKLAKWKTAAELFALILLLAVPALGPWIGTAGPGLYWAGAAVLWIAAALSAFTGLSYVRAVLKAA
jgi:cardiolipin synthase